MNNLLKRLEETQKVDAQDAGIMIEKEKMIEKNAVGRPDKSHIRTDEIAKDLLNKHNQGYANGKQSIAFFRSKFYVYKNANWIRYNEDNMTCLVVNIYKSIAQVKHVFQMH